MATFSVTANSYLRACYSYDRSLVKSANRTEASESKLSYADSYALKKAIKALGDFDYDADDPDETEFTHHLKAFIDSYNYSITSGKASSSSKIKAATENMKTLTSKYESQLKNLGVSINEKTGYMTVSSTATTNIAISKFKDVFGSDSDYMKNLEKYAKKVNHSIDVVI